MPDMKPQPRLAFPVLATVSLLLSLLFAWIVPEGVNPDETAHRDYIRLLVEKKRPVAFVPPPGRAPLPESVLAKIEASEGMRELPEGAPSRDEVHQPPLYYVLAALVSMASGGSLIAIRLLSALFQLATLWLVLRLVHELLPARPEVAVGAAAFVTVLPTQAQLGAAVSNDALTHLLCVALVGGALRWAARGGTVKEALLLGVVFGLGLWTKLTVLQLVPLLAIGAGVGAARQRLTAAQAAILVAVTVGVGLVLASPWLIRNLNLYGDPLGRTIYEATGPNFKPDQIQQAAGWSKADYLRNGAVRSWGTFFYFLHPNLPLNRVVGNPAPVLVTVVFGLCALVGLRRDPPAGNDAAVVGVAALAPVALIPFYLVFILTVFQFQGRYFLPSLLGVALVWSYGAAGVARGWFSVFVIPSVLLALCFVQLLNGGFMPR